jgi:TM2 domain-containing membrane protein YozV
MRKSLKGALLSGLVFPGYGQFVMKHYIRGIVLMLTCLTGLVVIGVKVRQQIFIVLEKIEYVDGAIDMSEIINAVNLAGTTSGDVIYRFASLLLLFCWIIGIIDAYRIGWRKDLEEQQKVSVREPG